MNKKIIEINLCSIWMMILTISFQIQGCSNSREHAKIKGALEQNIYVGKDTIFIDNFDYAIVEESIKIDSISVLSNYSSLSYDGQYIYRLENVDKTDSTFSPGLPTEIIIENKKSKQIKTKTLESIMANSAAYFYDTTNKNCIYSEGIEPHNVIASNNGMVVGLERAYNNSCATFLFINNQLELEKIVHGTPDAGFYFCFNYKNKAVFTQADIIIGESYFEPNYNIKKAVDFINIEPTPEKIKYFDFYDSDRIITSADSNHSFISSIRSSLNWDRVLMNVMLNNHVIFLYKDKVVVYNLPKKEVKVYPLNIEIEALGSSFTPLALAQDYFYFSNIINQHKKRTVY